MTSRTTRSRFLDVQRKVFASADGAHFAWQTGNPYLVRTERTLLSGFPVKPGTRVLEIGCGEGGNLVNLLETRLGPAAIVVGVDLFPSKLRFASSRVAGAQFVCADAGVLPFAADSFDAVLCRDVLHHLEDPGAATREAWRVCRRGGTVWIIEPNRYNPLMFVFALVRAHERGGLRSSVARIRKLVDGRSRRAEIDMQQPLPLYRALLHHQFGVPALGAVSSFARVMDGCERIFRACLPRAMWAYITARIEKT